MPLSDDLEARLRDLAPQERAQLELLRERLRGYTISPETIGDILPQAVPLGDKADYDFSKSMTEVTERAIDFSIRRDPETLSTALFPIIGAAIRKAMNKMMADLMAAMNTRLESAFSLKRLIWRVEAWRGGIPYAEIILRHTLRYRVEHLLLIHAKTGLLLCAVSRPDAKTADDDMVASMLTVIKDFIKDSLSLEKKEAVNFISAGDYNLIVEEGPKALTAAVVRGVPDNELRSAVQESLETVHRRLSGALEKFSGDTAPFEAAAEWLRPCLLSRESRKAGKRPVYAIVVVALAAAAVIAAVALAVLSDGRRVAFMRALEAEKGIAVISSRGRIGPDDIKLLRDSRARTVESVAAGIGIDPADYAVAVEPYYSPDFGAAPPVAPAALAERTVPEALLAIARRLGEYTLLFEQDSGELRAGQEAAVREAGILIADLVDKAKAAGFGVMVEITGHSAGTARDATAVAISEERAKKAMTLFTELNAPLLPYVRTRGVGIDEPLVAEAKTEEDRIRNRSVTFKAVFE